MGVLCRPSGGLIMTVYAYCIGLISAEDIGIAAMSAFLANNAESVIGATLQDKEGLK